MLKNSKRSSLTSSASKETQLHAIRDLMLSAAGRGSWMTLGEIARLTEVGEASISAQLRHLRKWRHGKHRVEKRRRRAAATASLFSRVFSRTERRKGRRRHEPTPTIWEYHVLPPGAGDAVSDGGGAGCAMEASHAEART